nr:hypothetical protein [Tanacetum cinerariifolium]
RVVVADRGPTVGRSWCGGGPTVEVVALVADREGGRGGVGHGGSSPWRVTVVAGVIHGGWSGRSCRGGRPEVAVMVGWHWRWPSVAAGEGSSVSWWPFEGPTGAVHGVVAARRWGWVALVADRRGPSVVALVVVGVVVCGGGCEPSVA